MICLQDTVFIVYLLKCVIDSIVSIQINYLPAGLGLLCPGMNSTVKLKYSEKAKKMYQKI